MRSKIGAGVAAGLLAGLVYGMVIQIVTVPAPMGEAGMGMEEGGMTMGDDRMPMMAMVAQAVRSESLVVGWVFLLLMGMVMGAIFAGVLGDRATRLGGGLAWGVVYGAFWWVLGTLILMPVLLGMSAFAPLAMASMRSGAVWSLAAYLLSGLILGAVFAGLYKGKTTPPASIPGP